MQETQSNKKVKWINPTQIGVIAVGLIILGIVAWLTPWVHLDNTPKPLGDKLEYVGKFDYGCIGCDAAPGAAYFYATDMSLEEVVEYFRGAGLVEEAIKESYSEAKGAQYRLNFTAKHASQRGFSLNYYDKGLYIVRRYGLHSTNKKFIIEIDSRAYQNAKDAI
jgi:hypothetical protein